MGVHQHQAQLSVLSPGGAALLALVFLLWGAPVQGQGQADGASSDASVGDSQPSPRRGVGRGSIEAHPGVRLEGGFDSNVFYEDEQEAPVSSFNLAVVPSIELKTRRSRQAEVNLDAEVRYLQYFSEDERVVEQSGFWLKGSGSVVFNPRGAVAFRLNDTFQRTQDAPNGAALGSVNRIVNTAGAGLLIQPGGRRLKVDLGGSFTVYRFGVIEDLNKQSVGLDARISYDFYPKTRAFISANWDFITYEQNQRQLPAFDDDLPDFLQPFEGDSTLQNINSQPLRVNAGLEGLIGPRFNLRLQGGFGKGFYDSGDDVNSFLALAEGSYLIGPTSRATLGYERDFTDSTLGNFTIHDKVFTRYNQQFGGRFDFMLEGNFRYVRYAPFEQIVLDQVSVEGQPGADAFSTTSRRDPIFGVKTEGTLFLGRVFLIGARYQLDVNATDFVMITGISAQDGQTDENDINTGGTATAQYIKHRAFLFTGVRW